MIYSIAVKSKEDNLFLRTIEINSDASFKELNDIILKSVGYDHSEMTAFFNCRIGWSPGEQITLMDMGARNDEENYLMDDTLLYDFMKEEGDRMLFNFDMFSDRSFLLILKEIKSGINDVPICTEKKGKAPAQKSDIDKMLSDFSQLGDDFRLECTNDEFDESELGEDGFSTLDDSGNPYNDIF